MELRKRPRQAKRKGMCRLSRVDRLLGTLRQSNIEPLVDRDGQGYQEEGVEYHEPGAQNPGGDEVQQDEKEEEKVPVVFATSSRCADL